MYDPQPGTLDQMTPRRSKPLPWRISAMKIVALSPSVTEENDREPSWPKAEARNGTARPLTTIESWLHCVLPQQTA